MQAHQKKRRLTDFQKGPDPGAGPEARNVAYTALAAGFTLFLTAIHRVPGQDRTERHSAPAKLDMSRNDDHWYIEQNDDGDYPSSATACAAIANRVCKSMSPVER